MMTRALVLWGILGLAVVPAQAEIKVGDKAPELTADAWYNLPSGIKELNKSHLEGQIIVVGFGTTRARQNTSLLREIHEKFRSRGVVLVLLSEEAGNIVADFVKKNSMPYIIGSGARTTFEQYGVETIPFVVIIDPDGKIASKGHPVTIDFELERLMKSNPPRQKGILAEKSGEEAIKRAKKLYDDKKYVEAIRAYEEVSRGFKGTKPGKDAREQLKRIKGNSRIMDIIKKEEAEKISGGWLECARICLQYGEKADAVRYYKMILDKYPDTKFAKMAAVELYSVEGDKEEAKSKDAGKEKSKEDGKDKDKKKAKSDDKEKKDSDGEDEEEEEEGEEENSNE